MADSWGQEPPKDVPVRKIKTSELPLSSATRTAIEGLSHKFKKKGGYDAIRHQVWNQLAGSDFQNNLVEQVKKVAIDTLENNPSLLSSTRKKSAILVEGHIERSDVYQKAEEQIRQLLLREHVGSIEGGIRELRVAEVGAEQAELEKTKGSKTDEEYAQEAAVRRNEREERRLEQERIREEERQKELAAENARREKERKEMEERRAEREARKAREREMRHAVDRVRDHDLRPDSSREHRRYGTDDRRDRGRDDYRRRDRRLDDHKDSPRIQSLEKPLSREETKRIEEEALAELLKDGKKVMQKSRFQAEPEIDETLAPPPRKTMPASAIMPIDRDSPARLEKKDSKSRLDDTGSVTGSIRSARHSNEKLDEKRSSRLRSRSRDRHSRRTSKDREYRSRRSSRERRKSRSRDRAREPEKERERERERERDRERDSRRREERDRPDGYDRRIRDPRKEFDPVARSSYRDSRRTDTAAPRPLERDLRRPESSSRLPERERDIRRTDSAPRIPERETKPITTVIDVDKDPVLSTLVGIKEGTTHSTRRYVNPAEEEQKLRDIKAREAEARAFAAKREEALAKGLPLPGWDRPLDNRPRLGSGSNNGGPNIFARPNWRSHGGGPLSMRDERDRKRDVETAGFATPAPREKKFDERPRDRDTRHSIEPISSSQQLRKESIVSTASSIPTGPSNTRFEKRRESVLSTTSASVTNMPRAQREDSHEAGEIRPGQESDPIISPPARVATRDMPRKRSRSRDRERRRDDRERERPRSRDRERERERERDGKRDDRRDDRGGDRRDDRRSDRKDDRERSYRDRRDDRGNERRDDRKPRSRSRERERDRRYRSRSRERGDRGDRRRDIRDVRDAPRSFGDRRR